MNPNEENLIRDKNGTLICVIVIKNNKSTLDMRGGILVHALTNMAKIVRLVNS